MTGIYKISCKITGQVYIGQSTQISRRWATHKRELRQGTHYNKLMQEAYNEYGEKSFEYEILEQCPAKKLDERERFYIKLFNSYEAGYNLTEGGGNYIGEQNPMYGVKGDKAPRFKDYILQLSATGDKIGRFDSSIAAARAIQTTSSVILRCLYAWQGKGYDGRLAHSAHGFQFIYEKDYEKLLPYHDFSHIIKKGEAFITTKMVDEGALDSDI